MTYQEIDEADITSNDITEEGEQGSGDENDTPASKNTSNFKKLAQAKKELERETQSLKQEKERLEKELDEWKNLNPEEAEALSKSKDYSKLEKKMFLFENPEAKEHVKDIEEAMKEYKIPMEKAWKLVKAEKGTPSETKKDYSVNNTKVEAKKDYSKMSIEDSEKLTKEERAEWRKSKWGEI